MKEYQDGQLFKPNYPEGPIAKSTGVSDGKRHYDIRTEDCGQVWIAAIKELGISSIEETEQEAIDSVVAVWRTHQKSTNMNTPKDTREGWPALDPTSTAIVAGLLATNAISISINIINCQFPFLETIMDIF